MRPSRQATRARMRESLIGFPICGDVDARGLPEIVLPAFRALP